MSHVIVARVIHTSLCSSRTPTIVSSVPKIPMAAIALSSELSPDSDVSKLANVSACDNKILFKSHEHQAQ